MASSAPVRVKPRRFPALLKEALLLITSLAVILWAWEGLANAKNIPTFFLPRPSQIAARFVTALSDGTLSRNAAITWTEALVAFLVALAFASLIGYGLAKSPVLEKVVSPYLIASQSLPVFAIAPFVLIWLGNGFVANAFMGALVAFFPMLVNTIVGIRGIGTEQRDVMRTCSATSWQTFTKLELPAALPVLFGGARVGITLSVIGVLVVELFWADRGIGYLLNFAQRQYDTPLLFAGILTLMIMNLVMYVALALLQRVVTPWRYIRGSSA